MNKTELYCIFAEMEPTSNQKSKMFEYIIDTNEIPSMRNFKTRKVLKLVASFVLVIFLTGTTAYATGLINNIVGSFNIYDNFVSWANNEYLLSKNEDIQDATAINYSKIYTYQDIDTALIEHDINIALPNSKLISKDLDGVTIKISNDNPDVEITKFQKNYCMGNKLVVLNIDCYKMLSSASSNFELGISTSQHADTAKKYVAKSGVTFTLLETTVHNKSTTVANVMIKDNKQIYHYILTFTDESEENIIDVLDSFDFSIYTLE